MSKTKLKIENFVDNKLENLSIIKGGDVGPPQSTGGNNTGSGNGGGLDPIGTIPPFPAKTPPPVEAPDVP